MEDLRFVHSDPHDGTWDKWQRNTSIEMASRPRPYTVWDDLYTGMIYTIDPIVYMAARDEAN